MSATNRGGSKEVNEAYFTPDWLCSAIIPYIKPWMPQKPRVLEPACGRGSVSDAAKTLLGASVDSVDIVDYGYPSTIVGDFLELVPVPAYDLIISNPPYSLAQDFVEHAMKFRRDDKSVVAMLLRVSFLGSQKRASWLRANTPSIYVTPRRPCFVNGRSDSAEYAWFVWRDPTPQVYILNTEGDAYK